MFLFAILPCFDLRSQTVNTSIMTSAEGDRVLTLLMSSCSRLISASVMSVQYGSTVAQKRSGASPLPLERREQQCFLFCFIYLKVTIFSAYLI